MNDMIVMQVTKSDCDLCSEEFHCLFWEPLIGKEMVIKVATSDVLKEEVESILVLEDEVHAEHEGMVGLE